MELITVISSPHSANQLVIACQCPLIQRSQCGIIHLVGIGIKAAEVTQHIPGSVPDLQVSLRQLLQDVLGDTHVLGVVRRGNPQAKHICAVVLDDLIGRNSIAQGLVHRAAFAVNSPAMGDDLLIGSHALGGDGGQHGRLEPAAILVAALQIHIGREMQLVPLIHHGGVGGARIEPNVHDIGFLGEVLMAALGAHKALRHQLVGGLLKPDVGAMVMEQVCNMIDGFRGYNICTALIAVENRNRHAPLTLTGNAPVGTLGNHGGHALFAPLRLPGDAVAGIHGSLLDGVNGAEPLLGGTEDNGLLAAPAMGIGVNDILLGQ